MLYLASVPLNKERNSELFRRMSFERDCSLIEEPDSGFHITLLTFALENNSKLEKESKLVSELENISQKPFRGLIESQGNFENSKPSVLFLYNSREFKLLHQEIS